jgi:hypothetical protein
MFNWLTWICEGQRTTIWYLPSWSAKSHLKYTNLSVNNKQHIYNKTVYCQGPDNILFYCTWIKTVVFLTDTFVYFKRTTGSLQYVFHLWHYPCARLHAYCVERECGWWTMNWNWFSRKQSWKNRKMYRKFPGGVEDTKQNSSPDSVSRPGSEPDIFEIQLISLTDKSTYSVT